MFRRLVVVALAGGCLFFLALYATFGSISVCDECGAICHSRAHQFPWTSATYWTSEEIQSTALSEVVAELELVEAHQHRWRLIHGSGNGVFCAQGNGLYVRRATGPGIVIDFIRYTHQYRGKEEAKAWVRASLDDLASPYLIYWLVTKGFHDHKFSTKDEYEAWRTGADEDWKKFAQWISPC